MNCFQGFKRKVVALMMKEVEYEFRLAKLESQGNVVVVVVVVVVLICS